MMTPSDLPRRALVVGLARSGRAAALALAARGVDRGLRLVAAGGVAALVAAWGVAQYPYLLPFSLTISDGAGAPLTLEWLLGCSLAALLTVGPDELDRGLVTTSADGRPVVVAAGWDTGGDVIVSARVELDDGSGPRWVTPVDVAQTALADGRPVTLTRKEFQVLGLLATAGGAVCPRSRIVAEKPFHSPGICGLTTKPFPFLRMPRIASTAAR